jgi:hypothetical protein
MYIDIPAHLAQYDSEIAQVICEIETNRILTLKRRNGPARLSEQ